MSSQKQRFYERVSFITKTSYYMIRIAMATAFPRNEFQSSRSGITGNEPIRARENEI